MIVHAAFVSHSPLLMPSIGKENTKALEKTSNSLVAVAKRFAELNVETLVTISAHHPLYKATFAGQIHDPYRADFSEFGDLTTTFSIKPDLETMDRLRHHLRDEGINFALDTHESLDYGTSIPLNFILPYLQPRLVSLAPTNLGFKEHVDFGVASSEILINSKRRIGILATGDLSSRLNSNSPGGFAKEGKIFDETIQRALANENISELVRLDQDLVQTAGECALRPLLMMLGMIKHCPFKTKILSYEAPFGVGYLAADISLDTICVV